MNKIIITITFILLAGCQLIAETLYVTTGQQGSYNTIQEAINAADTDDIIIISPGTYTGENNRDISFDGKAITVISQDPTDPCVVASTIIDPNGSETTPYRAFVFNSSETGQSVLDGVTITCGYSTYNGGGILCTNASPTIQNCTIKNCLSLGQGGALACENNSSPTINNCRITSNTATGYDGGGIACNNSTLHIINCTIDQNATDTQEHNNGGGIFCENDSDIFIETSFIQDNQAMFGGGIACFDSDVTLVNTVVSGNRTADNAGLGGAIYSADSELELTNCNILGNWAYSLGGGIKCSFTGHATLTNTIVYDNKVSINGTGPQIVVSDFDQITNLTTTDLITYCDIQGGIVHLDYSGSQSLTGSGIIIADPCFQTPGYWLADDADWIEGQYQLQISSPCVNIGDNDAIAGYSTDLPGENRIVSDTVDIGAYEMQVTLLPIDMTITKATVKAGKTENTDSFTFSGTITGISENDLLTAETIAISVLANETLIYPSTSPEVITIDTDSIKNGRYKYKGTTGGITSLQIDTNKETIAVKAKGIDLTGLRSLAKMKLSLDYRNSTVEIPETLMNRGKGTPIMLLSGYADTFTVDAKKFKIKQSTKDGTYSLTFRGGFSMATPGIGAGSTFTINWGQSQWSFPTVSEQGTKSVTVSGTKYKYKKSKENTIGVVSIAQFDWAKCTYSISVKGALLDSSDTSGDVAFGFEFDNFSPNPATVLVNIISN